MQYGGKNNGRQHEQPPTVEWGTRGRVCNQRAGGDPVPRYPGRSGNWWGFQGRALVSSLSNLVQSHGIWGVGQRACDR